MSGRQPLVGVIVGAGHFADIQLEAWRSVQGAAIAAVVDRDLAKAERMADKYAIRPFAVWEEAVSAVRPDFADICTPPDSHFNYVRLAADRGLPVLCQKPVAPTLEESEALVRYCAGKRVPLMINENWRWQAWYREMKRMINAGMLGRVYTAYFAMRPGDGWGDQPYPVQPYFKHMERFLLNETGVHFIDTFRYLFGEMESVYCRTSTINPVIAGEDFAIVHVNFRSGAAAVYDANRTTYMEKVRSSTYGTMTIEGTEGKLRLDEDGRLYFTPRGGTEREYKYMIPKGGWKGGCTIAAQQHFVDGLLQGVPFETPGDDYLRTVRTVYACYDSARLGQVIRLEA
jgi:predicted dehydrogenase